MEHDLLLSGLPGRSNGPAVLRLDFWRPLGRIGLIALAIIFALSTQFLFQAGLYEIWPLPDILRGWLDYFLDLLVVGGCIFIAVAVAASPPARSSLEKHLLLLASIALGALSGEILEALRLSLPLEAPAFGIVLAKAARWFAVGSLAYAIYTLLRRAAEAGAQAHQSELQRVQFDRQMTEARLQSLRAQIEPHFLFNTLANIHRLYQTDRGLGRRMLSNFVAYLRAALPHLRHDETTLGQEADLARAYLNVLQVRMGERLRYRLDVPDDLGALSFPPFALSTLTENAVKHGLNPLPEGGSIEIAARVANGRLTVEVADTGAGLRQTSGTGAGVANLRARLAALYGNEAGLSIEANAPRGIRAAITVPVRTVQAKQD